MLATEADRNHPQPGDAPEDSFHAMFFFVLLSRRGTWRWISLAIFILAPITVIIVYAFAGLLWVAVGSAAAWLLAGMTACSALAGGQTDRQMPERPAEPPAQHPYLIMNRKSGGGKVGKFDLKRKAEGLGAEVFLLDGPGPVDIAKVAREAVAHGADLLGVAGGDGMQALVTGIAAEHGIPFVVICAGTRNHFALDLGLDREDPSGCLGALSDGVELRVDLGMTPVTCTVSPSALRVWVPRDRPGVPAPKPPVNWARLRHLAGIRHERAEIAA